MRKHNVNSANKLPAVIMEIGTLPLKQLQYQTSQTYNNTSRTEVTDDVHLPYDKAATHFVKSINAGLV